MDSKRTNGVLSTLKSNNYQTIFMKLKIRLKSVTITQSFMMLKISLKTFDITLNKLSGYLEGVLGFWGDNT